MGRRKLTNEEKARALAQLEQGVPVIKVAANIGVSRKTIYGLISAAASLPPGQTPPRKSGTGRKKKTSPRADTLIKREVLNNPSISAVALKKKFPDLLQDVAIRTVQHRLQKDLGLPCRRSAKKPLLTVAMKKKRVDFCKKYKTGTKEQCREVMFSDESTFRKVPGASNILWRPKSASRYHQKYTVETVKHPLSVMVSGTFSGKVSRAELFFLSYVDKLMYAGSPFFSSSRRA